MTEALGKASHSPLPDATLRTAAATPDWYNAPAVVPPASPRMAEDCYPKVLAGEDSKGAPCAQQPGQRLLLARASPGCQGPQNVGTPESGSGP